METLEWRRPARIVAYVDLILTIIMLLFLLLLTFVTLGYFASFYNSDSGAGKNTHAVNALILYIILSISIICVFIQFWAVSKLLTATNLLTDFHSALRMATTWRNVTVVFFILSIFDLALKGRFFTLVISIAIRAIFFYIVHKFMQELEQRLTTPAQIQAPSEVFVNK